MQMRAFDLFALGFDSVESARRWWHCGGPRVAEAKRRIRRRRRLSGRGYYRRVLGHKPWADVPEGVKILCDHFARNTPAPELNIYKALDDFVWATECYDMQLITFTDYLVNKRGTLADFEWRHGCSNVLANYTDYLKQRGVM